jgi:glycosyltransferase involved in cell wall biosynthesis
MQSTPKISIIVPLFNEYESLLELKNWICSTINPIKIEYEVIFIDDGSTDNSWCCIKEFALNDKNIHGISFSKNFGKSQALHAGFKKAKGEFVFTMDADLQDSPEEIPLMLEKLIIDKLDLISGWKKERFDSIIFKNIPSKLFNWAARKVSGVKLHDFNCGIKGFRNDVIKNIYVYGDMHRYIPVLASQKGFNKIDEHVVKHQARKFGKTKFGNDRFYKGFLDLITLWFFQKFGKRPMHFFGVCGTLMFIMGFMLTIYIGVDKLYIDVSGRLITQRPQFYIALTLIILGTQLFIAGFLGEIVLKMKKKTNHYYIAETT